MTDPKDNGVNVLSGFTDNEEVSSRREEGVHLDEVEGEVLIKTRLHQLLGQKSGFVVISNRVTISLSISSVELTKYTRLRSFSR